MNRSLGCIFAQLSNLFSILSDRGRKYRTQVKGIRTSHVYHGNTIIFLWVTLTAQSAVGIYEPKWPSVFPVFQLVELLSISITITLYFWFYRTVQTHKGWIKKIRFGPGKGNLSVVVLYDDGCEVWDADAVKCMNAVRTPKQVSDIG